ncbi:membrane or secreted protein [Lutimonas sp.]|uniref:membrane or secreted protein n=1 Tax=Lutimonas sp. TaxID=1872403 RepID=UPI003D9BFCB4
MKTLVLLPLTLCCLLCIPLIGSNWDAFGADNNKQQRNNSDASPDLQGAWSSSEINDAGEKITITTIVMDGYLAETFYNEKSNAFVKTFGGSWVVKDSMISLTREFSSNDSASIGKTRHLIFDLRGDTITFKGNDKIWTRIDDGKKGALNGAWLISGRERDGNMIRRAPSARKTMKILSDSRFQWIAYNTDTGKFFGTGGGTYSAENGTYTEHIEFFSRDNSRVGASLSFQYDVKENEWHHRGLSSKGSPIYEIWSPRIMPQKEE